MQQLAIEGVNVRAHYATESLLENIRQHGLAGWVWDCHDEPTMLRMASLGVDAIYTNYPDRLGSVLGNRGGARSG
jgi:glycerophosphoryl diester phosphodiesterase